MFERAIKFRKDQMSCTRRNGNGKCNHTIQSYKSICCLCTVCCVWIFLVVVVDYHGFIMQVKFSFKKKINIALPSCCIKLSNANSMVTLPKSQGGGEFLRFLAHDEKFMHYAPHSGFNNQVMELKNALVVAKILNRTLVIPPLLEHHAVWLGSCPKRRVLRPHRLRALVWTKIFHLISNSSARYTSIADILELSSITPSQVKTIDLRVFVALWCGVNITGSCGGPQCLRFAKKITNFASVSRDSQACIRSLNPPRTQFNRYSVYGVDEDCTSTIWTYDPTEPLPNATAVPDTLRNHKLPNLKTTTTTTATTSWVQLPVRSRGRGRITDPTWFQAKRAKEMRRTVQVKDVRSSLGSRDSVAGKSSVLAFGSLFSMMYRGVPSHIHIPLPSGDEDLDHLLRSLKTLSFSSEILAAARTYVEDEVRSGHREYFCAQIRVSDGQFKNHRNATFRALKAQLTSSFRSSSPPSWSTNGSIPVLVMTDLPSENWTEAERKSLWWDSDRLYEVHKLSSRRDLVEMASRRVLKCEAGFVVGSMRGGQRQKLRQEEEELVEGDEEFQISAVELAMEEVGCSCAPLGFFGTPGSTIAESIRDLRATNICSH